MKKAAPWFYYPAELEAGKSGRLSDEEARHAAGSRRLEPGDALTLFDGSGVVADALVVAVGSRGRDVAFEVSGTHNASSPALALHLACALPKGDRLASLLDMATQLGMSSFTPIDCARSVVKVSENAERRWQRILIEACKQSRRPYLPIVRPATRPQVLAEQCQGELWIAHPGGSRPAELSPEAETSLTIMIGPEGGFTEEEVDAVTAQGAHKVSLGAGILRTESAAIALLAYARLAFAVDA